MAALVSPAAGRGMLSEALPGEDQVGESDFYAATPLGDVMISDSRPVECIAACLVFCNPVAGRQAAFNDWYSSQHLPDVLRVPGYLSAQRFSLAPPEGTRDPGWRYLAVYEVDFARYESAIAEVIARSGTELMPISDSAQRPVAAHFLLPKHKRLLPGRPVGS